MKCKKGREYLIFLGTRSNNSKTAGRASTATSRTYQLRPVHSSTAFKDDRVGTSVDIVIDEKQDLKKKKKKERIMYMMQDYLLTMKGLCFHVEDKPYLSEYR